MSCSHLGSLLGSPSRRDARARRGVSAATGPNGAVSLPLTPSPARWAGWVRVRGVAGAACAHPTAPSGSPVCATLPPPPGAPAGGRWWTRPSVPVWALFWGGGAREGVRFHTTTCMSVFAGEELCELLARGHASRGLRGALSYGRPAWCEGGGLELNPPAVRRSNEAVCLWPDPRAGAPLCQPLPRSSSHPARDSLLVLLSIPLLQPPPSPPTPPLPHHVYWSGNSFLSLTRPDHVILDSIASYREPACPTRRRAARPSGRAGPTCRRRWRSWVASLHPGDNCWRAWTMAFVVATPVQAGRIPLRLAVDRPWTGEPVRGRLAAAAVRRPAWCHGGGAPLLRRRGSRVGPSVEPPRCQHTSESEPPDYSTGWVPEKVWLAVQLV